jgi:hypothetical protein
MSWNLRWPFGTSWYNVISFLIKTSCFCSLNVCAEGNVQVNWDNTPAQKRDWIPLLHFICILHLKPIEVKIVFTVSVSTTKKTQCIFIINISWLMMFNEIIPVYCVYCTKLINTLWAKWWVTNCYNRWSVQLALGFKGLHPEQKFKLL